MRLIKLTSYGQVTYGTVLKLKGYLANKATKILHFKGTSKSLTQILLSLCDHNKIHHNCNCSLRLVRGRIKNLQTIVIGRQLKGSNSNILRLL